MCIEKRHGQEWAASREERGHRVYLEVGRLDGPPCMRLIGAQVLPIKCSGGNFPETRDSAERLDTEVAAPRSGVDGSSLPKYYPQDSNPCQTSAGAMADPLSAAGLALAVFSAFKDVHQTVKFIKAKIHSLRHFQEERSSLILDFEIQIARLENNSRILSRGKEKGPDVAYLQTVPKVSSCRLESSVTATHGPYSDKQPPEIPPTRWQSFC